jgi:hypothetical protein
VVAAFCFSHVTAFVFSVLRLSFSVTLPDFYKNEGGEKEKMSNKNNKQ